MEKEPYYAELCFGFCLKQSETSKKYMENTQVVVVVVVVDEKGYVNNKNKEKYLK